MTGERAEAIRDASEYLQSRAEISNPRETIETRKDALGDYLGRLGTGSFISSETGGRTDIYLAKENFFLVPAKEHHPITRKVRDWVKDFSGYEEMDYDFEHGGHDFSWAVTTYKTPDGPHGQEEQEQPPTFFRANDSGRMGVYRNAGLLATYYFIRNEIAVVEECEKQLSEVFVPGDEVKFTGFPSPLAFRAIDETMRR